MAIPLIAAMTALEIGSNIIFKAIAAAKANKPVDLSDEIAALEASRLAPSEDIIKEADIATGRK